MKNLLVIFFIIFNAWNAFDIYINYAHDEIISLLSIRIMVLVISFVLSVIYIIVRSPKSTVILSIINIIVALIHGYMILVTYL